MSNNNGLGLRENPVKFLFERYFLLDLLFGR